MRRTDDGPGRGMFGKLGNKAKEMLRTILPVERKLPGPGTVETRPSKVEEPESEMEVEES